jgi:HK97 gp10 family phage protein
MTMQVIGADDIAKVLSQFAPRVANNLAKAVIHGVAGEITKKAKAKVPTKTGNLKKALKTKRRRGKPGQPVSDVIVSQGKSAKNDGFYWRFVEYGTQTGSKEQPFIRPAKDAVFGQLDSIIDNQFKKKLIAAVNREKKRKAKK